MEAQTPPRFKELEDQMGRLKGISVIRCWKSSQTMDLPLGKLVPPRPLGGTFDDAPGIRDENPINDLVTESELELGDFDNLPPVELHQSFSIEMNRMIQFGGVRLSQRILPEVARALRFYDDLFEVEKINSASHMEHPDSFPFHPPLLDPNKSG
ncbi:hypothetical protein CPB86DRAFT_827928 [Serendipita vermifera]|nr:hypothetical protein CPB86DRAFT_827928 [Serendipita vermifera]